MAPTAIASNGRSIPQTHWSARFLNLTSSTVDRYDLYDFSQADAVYDLGENGQTDTRVAALHFNYGLSSPVGIQADNFAMEACTRIRLPMGRFFRLTSTSDDGVRFLFKDRHTQEVLAELAGDWRDRSIHIPAGTHVLTTPQRGGYDFYIQYYDRTGIAALTVTLDRIWVEGRVLASTLNVRSGPGTSNPVIGTLRQGTIVTITRWEPSPDDRTYPNWYRVIMPGGTKGYVVMDANLVEPLGEASNVITVGKTPVFTRPRNIAIVSSKVWRTSDKRIALRSDKDVSATELGRLVVGTPLTILGKEVGGRYLNGFDYWYHVQANVGGRIQTGYIAAYYVNVQLDEGQFDTAISKANGLYKFHISEVLTPQHFSKSYRPLIEAAAVPYPWLSPAIIAAIGSRESVWGRVLSPPGPKGTGDGGHGRGLMQIDDRYHKDFINSGRWRDPEANIDYGIHSVLSKSYNDLSRKTTLTGLDLLRGAIAAYNAGLTSVINAITEGRDIDYYTTGQDYSWDVLNRAGWYQLHGLK